MIPSVSLKFGGCTENPSHDYVPICRFPVVKVCLLAFQTVPQSRGEHFHIHHLGVQGVEIGGPGAIKATMTRAISSAFERWKPKAGDNQTWVGCDGTGKVVRLCCEQDVPVTHFRLQRRWLARVFRQQRLCWSTPAKFTTQLSYLPVLFMELAAFPKSEAGI